MLLLSREKLELESQLDAVIVVVKSRKLELESQLDAVIVVVQSREVRTGESAGRCDCCSVERS